MAKLANLTVAGGLTLPSGTAANRTAVTSTVQSFTTVGTTSWTAPAGVTQVEVLVVAGGGSGVDDRGGGGGGGGVVYNSAYPVVPGTIYTVTVGNGGAATARTGVNGGNSVFGTLTAIGGGGGGNGSGVNGNTGGSGGGAGNGGGADATTIGGRGTLGQGYNGGPSVYVPPNYGGGGGGGAGGPGQAGTSLVGGDGGPGLMFSISGTPIFYGGGGGGGAYGGTSYTPGKGGAGGGGNGGSTTEATSGAANTGGGGGSNGSSGGVPTSGGSGIVIIRYSLSSNADAATGDARFNIQLNALETFSNGTWKVPAATPNVNRNGLVISFDGKYAKSGSTVLPDISGNNVNATLTNGAAWDSTSEGCILLDGVNDYISVSAANPAIPLGVSMAYEVWIYPTSYKIGTGQIRQYLIDPRGDGSESGASTYFLFDYNSSLDYVTILTGNSGIEVTSSPVRMPIGQWHHIVASRSGNTWNIYLNGVLIKTGTSNTTALTFSTSFRIGTYANGSSGQYFFQGRIAVANIYGRALTADEVQQNYNLLRSRFVKLPYPARPTIGTTAGTAASSLDDLKNSGITENGTYWFKTPSMTAPAQFYVDFTTRDGPWARIWLASSDNYNSTSEAWVYGQTSNFIRDLTPTFMYCFVNPSTNVTTQAWKFNLINDKNNGNWAAFRDTPHPWHGGSGAPNITQVNAWQLSSGVGYFGYYLRTGISSFGGYCDDGRGGVWGQTCLKNSTSSAVGSGTSPGGLLDFPHYASYSYSGQDDCSRSDQPYTATKCDATRRFAIYVR